MRQERPLGTAFVNGLKCKCPACGEGKIFKGYIKVRHSCDHCGLELHHQRADDAPPYFTMLIVLHFVVSGILTVEQLYSPANWVQLVIWMPVATLMSFLLLPPIKGALIGIQWAKEMHGFNPEKDGYTAQQID
ncbi:DUF983 domain-containing protein [Sneathiella glossodoripedis]|uniref:DUF983 domain-containing protein n=1 Tax=Sneathiella glossodoripedis TaxID=418853 RepID=UPI001901567F|nr:DUF983 domain-containing protein [Sneathiella glossodoripedis]